MTFAPRSWPSNPGFAIRTRIGRSAIAASLSIRKDDGISDAHAEPVDDAHLHAEVPSANLQETAQHVEIAASDLRMEPADEAIGRRTRDREERVADSHLAPDPSVLVERLPLRKLDDEIGADANRLERGAVRPLGETQGGAGNEAQRRPGRIGRAGSADERPSHYALELAQPARVRDGALRAGRIAHAHPRIEIFRDEVVEVTGAVEQKKGRRRGRDALAGVGVAKLPDTVPEKARHPNGRDVRRLSRERLDRESLERGQAADDLRELHGAKSIGTELFAPPSLLRTIR